MTTAFAKDMKKLPRKPRRAGPVWKGPEQDGVTYSLLSRFLCCRERFRVLVVEGLKPHEKFNPKLEFGQMWHVCEEALAAADRNSVNRDKNWQECLKQYAMVLCKRYPMQQDQVNYWYNVAKALFPIYVDHWSKHPDVQERTPLLQEQVFDVPYRLPSGRTVRLRGKWDSVDSIGKGKEAGVYLQENKTKSSIDGAKITRQLSFDLQTMTYLVALKFKQASDLDGGEGNGIAIGPIRGVRYNVVRRSAHKSVESMLKKLGEDRAGGRVGEWFARWKVEVSAADVARFRRECLDPVLENLHDDYEWWAWCAKVKGGDDGSSVWDYFHRAKRFPRHQSRHYREPFGIYDPVKEGGSSDLDAYLETGSEVGLRRTDNLFPELV